MCYNEKSGLVDDVQIKKVYPNKKGLNYSGNFMCYPVLSL